MFRMKAKFSFFVFSIFSLILLSACVAPQQGGAGGSYRHGGHAAQPKKCSIDIECGVQSKCVEGVCTGGIAPKIRGKCVAGKFGKKVCSNSGKPCNVNSQCLGP